MTDRSNNEPRIVRADEGLTVRGRWRWLLPLGLLVAVGVGGWALYESGRMNGPTPGASMSGRAPVAEDSVGTGGRAPTVPSAGEPDAAAIRDLETITGVNDRNPLVGRKVELHVPVAAGANDYAFWVGEADNRLLVVPQRDRRDSKVRQEGGVADHGISSPLDAGTIVAISGSLQRLPKPEERYSWQLTDKEQQEAAAMGVYLRADTVAVQ